LYLLTGHFSEVSKRSQLTYLFRKGRPTIVLRESDDGAYALCALCLHPIGYYGDTWAGVMCPTDEVLAHLLMMRGSEEKFWANANQHPLVLLCYDPNRLFWLAAGVAFRRRLALSVPSDQI
jgi:hypothetical protein